MHAPVASHILLGRIMREVREQLEVSQAALAHKLGHVQSYIAQFENAHQLPGEGQSGAWQRWLTAVEQMIAKRKPQDPQWSATLRAKLTEASRLYAQTRADYAALRQDSIAAAKKQRGPGIIGERIAQLRRDRTPRMTQEALAERAGVSVDLISKLEQGVKQTALITSLRKIANALEVEVTVLLSERSRIDHSAPRQAPIAAAKKQRVENPHGADDDYLLGDNTMPPTTRPPSPDAPAVVHLGWALRKRREAMPKTREGLSAAIGYGVGVIKSIENGTYTAKLHHYLARWVEVFGPLDSDLQRLWGHAQAEQARRDTPRYDGEETVILNSNYQGKLDELDAMDRLAFLRSAATIAGSYFLAVPPMGSLTSSRVDPDALRDLNRVVDLSWRLSQGEDFIALEYLLPTYLPRLTVLAQEPSKDQRILAALAAQGYILAGLVSVLKGRAPVAEMQCSQAVLYSRLANDNRLEVASLKHLATKYLDAGRPFDTISAYEQALPIIDDLSFDSPLLKSRTYLGLAVAYARCNSPQEAQRYLGMAKETFPDHPEGDPSFGYADCGLWSLNHYEGLLRLQFSQATAALEEFEGAVNLGVAIPQRTIVELLNCQAEAAVKGGDIELACDRVIAAFEGAQRLDCDKRFADALRVYRQMRNAWPREDKVLELNDLFSSRS